MAAQLDAAAGNAEPALDGRCVYLPRGRWIDYDTGEVFDSTTILPT